MKRGRQRCRCSSRAAQLPVGHVACRGDVRARRRHLADERLDLRGGRGSRHDGERRAVRDRARGPGLGRVHPDQQQGGRPHRSQAGLRPGPARLRHRRPGDDAGPEPDRDHHLLGDPRRSGGIAAAARHAVTHPRELRRSRSQEDLRPGRGSGGHRRSGRTAARRLRHHLPVVAGRLPPRSRWSSRWCSPTSSWSATCPTPGPRQVDLVGAALSVVGMGGVVLGILVWQEGGEAVGALIAAGLVGLVALAYWLRAPQASRQADAARPGPVPASRTSGSASRSRCCSRSPSAAR